MLDRVNHPCPVWRPRISAEFHGARKSLQSYPGGHFSKGNRALIPPPVSAGSRGGVGGSRGPGIWELESRIWRPSWESNLGEQSGERELESRSWRAPWESNLGEQSGHAVWGLALGSLTTCRKLVAYRMLKVYALNIGLSLLLICERL